MMNTILRWLRHNNTTLVLSFIAFWLPLIIFFRLADDIIRQQTIPFDRVILTWLHAHASPVLDAFFFTFTTLGGVLGIVVLTTGLFAYFLVNNHRTRALFLLACVGGAAAANVILKGLFHRARPDLFKTFVIETNYSFPSGHAMGSMALALSLIIIFWPTKWRWLVTALGALFVLCVGLSRPYFGVHYPSDIIAGWCASIGWVLLVFFVVKKFGLKIRPLATNSADSTLPRT